MIVLDTNVVSELMKPAPHDAVRRWLSGLGDSTLATTAVTVSEIVYGLARLPDGQRRITLEARFEAYMEAGFVILPLDDAAARAAGAFRAMREAAGLGARAADMMIAGIAAAANASLATRNIKDFAGLPVRVADPWR
jgi:predicted nucleic acid-binding protein